MSSKKLTPLSHTEAASFCSQMALILKSGISSVEGISIMLEDAKELNEKELLTQIYEKMIQTGVLYESLAVTNVFPDYLLQMVKILQIIMKKRPISSRRSNTRSLIR